MGKVFRKAVLSVNEYQSGDGSVTVTPDRLKHWEKEFRRLSDAGYVVPMHFNHADIDDLEMLSPITMDSLSKRDTRGAHNTEGRMVDFQVTPDGQSAEITVEVLTPSAIEKVEHNSIFVSPVIFPEFRDGHGHTYADVITSVDLVDYPVDHSQGPFVPAEPITMGCVIRMGVSPNYYTPRIKRMDMAAGQDAGMDMAPPSDTGMNQGGDVVALIVDALQECGIALPEDTDASNIVDRIKQVMGNGGQGGQADGASPVVTSPEIQTMSAQVRSARAFAETAYHRDLLGRLESLRDSGRIMDEEFARYSARIAAQRLSLDAYNKPREGETEKFMRSREVIPEGTFKTATFRKGGGSKLARMSVAEPPNAEDTEAKEKYWVGLINGKKTN